MQIRGPGDKSPSLALENRAMREYTSPAWLDHRPAGERSWLWSCPPATAGEVALKDIASQRPTSGLYSAPLDPAHRQNSPSALFSTFVKMISRFCSANPINSGLRLSGRARWHGVVYIRMQAESGITTSRADYLLVDGHRMSRS